MAKSKERTPSQQSFRAIPFNQIPMELRPLAVQISKLEKDLITTKSAIEMSFEHLFNRLVEVKKASMDLIQQAKMLEKAKVEEPEEKTPNKKK